MRIALTETKFMKIPIYGPAGTDVTQFVPVKLALVKPGAEPQVSDYHTGQWLGGEAALLIGSGPSGTPYAAGDYKAFATFTAGSEILVFDGGRVSIGLADT